MVNLVGFGRILITGKFGWIWANLVGFGWIWTDLVGFGRGNFLGGDLLNVGWHRGGRGETEEGNHSMNPPPFLWGGGDRTFQKSPKGGDVSEAR